MMMRLQPVGIRMLRQGLPGLETLSGRVRLGRVERAEFADVGVFRLVLRLVGLAVSVARAVALEGR